MPQEVTSKDVLATPQQQSHKEDALFAVNGVNCYRGDPSQAGLASKWLRECIESHALCPSSAPPQLPLRVIDVLSRDEPFLLETRGASGEYLALSYCWGPVRNTDMMAFGPNSKSRGRQQKVPAPNIESHKKQIPFSLMPRTLQDAVTICRQLRVRYLWIDSFCVVQCDDEEWKTESPKMADIYANAKLTIAADKAVDLDKGFLDRGYLTQPQREAGSSDVALYEGERHRIGGGNNTASSHVSVSPLLLDEPLNKRAWSLSEAIFSNRIVHFTSSEMIWECNHVRRCEHGYSWTIQDGELDSFRIFRNVQLAQRCTKSDFYRHWDVVVQRFAIRQINSSPAENHKDDQKLSALARLARRFWEILDENFQCRDEYLAGMWKGDLPRSLIWSVESGGTGPHSSPRRPITARAPS